MTHPAPTVNRATRNGNGRFTSPTAEREELVVEILARLGYQIDEHGEISRTIVEEQGRDAVADTLFARAIANARFQIAHGTREQQLAAVDRIERVQATDEAAEEAVFAALLGLVGAHNVDAHQLVRLVKANRAALTGDAPVALDEPEIPAHVLERQKAVRA